VPRTAPAVFYLADNEGRGVLINTPPLSRTVDFLPLAGRTAHTCALRSRAKPAMFFFGPALARAASGWRGLKPLADDHSYENRSLGAVGLRRLKYEYAFTDDFDPIKSRYGPGAGRAIGLELEKARKPA